MPVSGQRMESVIDYIEGSMRDAVAAGVIRVRVTDGDLQGTSIRVRGKDLANFGSCSYLGLGLDARLSAGARSAVDRFGTSYSSSAAYASVDLYTDLEQRLTKILGGPLLIAPTTTLGHLAALPVLVSADDLVVMDAQAHASLHLAADVLRGRGVKIKTVRHNDVGALRRVLEAQSPVYRRIWYLADGVYSMHGDFAPFAEINDLMDEFEQLHVYYDDAHGFGWAGQHGAGSVLGTIGLRDRIVVAVSLSKSFGAGGAAIVCKDERMIERILLTGGTLTFGGPTHPAALGAGVASADIHLGSEHTQMQNRLMENIDLVHRHAHDAGLGLVRTDSTPISFVHVGTAGRAIEVAAAMMKDGFFVNPSAFPAVPRGQGGVRFTVTAAHTEPEIAAFVYTLARHIGAPLTIDLTDGSSTLTDRVTA